MNASSSIGEVSQPLAIILNEKHAARIKLYRMFVWSFRKPASTYGSRVGEKGGEFPC